MSYIKYIDVSEHQGVIDWEKVKGQVDGVIIRAGYGRNNIDKQFVRNITECNRLGIPCGAYWFSYAYTVLMATDEASYFLKAIKPYRIELPVAFDWEDDSREYANKKGVNPDKTLISAMTRVFLNECERNGYYAMIYTNPATISSYVEESVLTRYDLWLAQWPSKWSENSVPQRKCGIWQWGGTKIEGISSKTVDTNRAYKDYYKMLKKTVVTEVKTEEETIIEAVANTAKATFDTLKWAKDLGIVTGDSAEDKRIAEAIYRYHMAFMESDDKSVSGLLTED